jgi:LemA protein
VIIGIGIVLLLVVVGMYNNLARRRIQAQTAWSDVDVQLKRRHDLIPNLVETVKGYAGHERNTLEAVIAARTQAVGAKSVAEHAQAENMLTQTLGRLFALSEAYPDLKANKNFMALQEELTSTENKIGFSRQYYNRTVSQYNEAIAVFPGHVIAGMFNFGRMDFFELDNAAEREAPKVAF